ncbi:MAG: hypothetical protein KDI13_09495 [Alphaproteobacteria bacterium]|nr:hypothetical protein [Alphaproteobacteria bacterium]
MTPTDKSKDRDEIMKVAMQELRSARKSLQTDHPELFARLEILAKKRSMEEEIRTRTKIVDPDLMHRQKNIETIQKMLTLKGEGNVIRKSVQALLSKVTS